MAFTKAVKSPAHSAWSKRRATLLRALISPVEPLERRVLLSVSASVLAGPVDVPGTQWEYLVTTAQGQTATFKRRVIGETTFNGTSAIEIDQGSTLQGKLFVGFDSQGNYVEYGDTSVLTNTTQTDVYTPPKVDFPAQLSAGVTNTANTTVTTTRRDNAGDLLSTDTSQTTEQSTLLSQTTSSVTVPLGTYDAYQVTSVDTNTFPNGDGTNTVQTTTITGWFVPGIGFVKESDSNGNSYELTAFSSTKDHLAFTVQPPAKTAAGKTLAPAIEVTALDANNNPDANATGSITLTLNPFLRAGTGTLSGTQTQPLVGGVASFSDLSITTDGNYQFHATDTAGDPAVDSNKFRIGATGMQLEINSRFPGGSKGVKTGDTISYSVLVTPARGKTIQDSVLILTIPAGFTPTGISANGAFDSAASTITWQGNARVYNFFMAVPSAQVLNGIKNVTVTGDDNVAYTDQTTDEAIAADSVKLATSYEIDGDVHDAIYKFPKISKIVTSSGLGGVVVNMIDSTGAVVDTVSTKGNGKFKLTAKAAGTYTIQFIVAVDMYSTTANAISKLRAYFAQTVTLQPSNTTPIDLGTLVLPKTFLDTAAGVLLSLNNYKTSTFGGLALYEFNLFQFDTTSAEAVLAALAGTAANPGTFMNPAALRSGAAVDPWVAAIRMIAGLWEVGQRFTEAYKLVDVSAKALSVVLSVRLVKFMQDKIKIDNNANPGVRKWNGLTFIKQDETTTALNQGERIALFTAMGEGISWAADAVVATLPFPAQEAASYKAALITATFSGIRFGYDLLTGQGILNDGIFEAAFNLIRIGFDMIVLQGFAGAQIRLDIPSQVKVLLSVPLIAGAVVGTLPPNMQDVINRCVSFRLNYDTATDTELVLDTLDTFNDQRHGDYLFELALVSTVNNLSGFIRGIDGAGFKLKDVTDAIAKSPTRLFIQSKLVKASAAFSKVIVGGGKAIAGGLLIPGFTTAAFGFIEQLYTTQFVSNIVQNNLLTVPSATSTALPSGPISTALPAAAAQPAVSSARLMQALAVSPAAGSAFLADLAQLSALVKANDTDGIAALYPQLVSDETALFGDGLVLLDEQLFALTPQFSTSAIQTSAGFDVALHSALDAVTFMSEQLDLWGGDPATGSSAIVLSQIKSTIKAVQSAVSQASVASGLIGALTIPVTLSVSPADVPTTMTAGTSQTFTFIITNVGSSPSAEGKITYINTDGSLVVQSAAELSLPPLAAGASTTLTWQVQAVAPASPDLGSVFQLNAVAGDVLANFNEHVSVSVG